MSMFNRLLNFFLPNQCLVCQKVMRGGVICYHCWPEHNLGLSLRCRGCFSTAITLDSSSTCYGCRSFPPLFNELRFLWSYEAEVRPIITVMKYRPSEKIAHLLGAYLASKIDSLFRFIDWDIIIPMAATKQSLHERGFNQCQYLAQAVARKIGAPLSYALINRGTTHPQASLRNVARIGNVSSAFHAAAEVSGKRVLLVEDVITTGATSTAATLALLKSGAASVDLLAIARANVWLEMRSEIYSRIRASTV